ncbi:MAG: hypothetical protein KGI10_03310 [Thaumarchaeota archaeon]|nr:hypothetical protein [Nitrososphaerota archaeon]
MSASQSGSLQYRLEKRFNYDRGVNEISMVLSMVDQHKPKCYLCSNVFENLEELRRHQENAHKEFVEFHKDVNNHSPTPGDVTIF